MKEIIIIISLILSLVLLFSLIIVVLLDYLIYIDCRDKTIKECYDYCKTTYTDKHCLKIAKSIYNERTKYDFLNYNEKK